MPSHIPGPRAQVNPPGLRPHENGTRLMTSQLYEVSPLDPLSLVVACAAMIGIAVAAGLVPASRASRVHPISVLRDDG